MGHCPSAKWKEYDVDVSGDNQLPLVVADINEFFEWVAASGKWQVGTRVLVHEGLLVQKHYIIPVVLSTPVSSTLYY